MRSFFQPVEAPAWLKISLDSIRDALSDIWPTPVRLKDYTTANFPTAADWKQGLAYDSTLPAIKFSDGTNWTRLMNYNPGAALTRVDDTNVTLTLGGTPATALLQAVSITVGWSGTLAATRGGTGIGSYAVGDILYASTTTALAKLADVATGNALISGGVNTAPSWGKIGLTTHVSGILAGANGGTNNGFTEFTGPATSTKTFTLPNASETIACLGQAQTFTAAQTFPNSSGIKIRDTDNSNTTGIVGGSNLTADRTLTITTGDANKSIDITNTTFVAAGVQFPATQVTSADANCLDDYEEGTFTPGVAFGGASTGITYSGQAGRYTKVGRLVFVEFSFTLSSKGSATGNATFTGLPFSAGSNAVGQAMLTNMTGLTSSVITWSSGTTLLPFCQGATTWTQLNDTNFNATSGGYVSTCYSV